ncbi:hypothetical protein [Vibrio coralliilyticus]|uniref:hypothetical protein n=1 Tax=Vibrio coralliilyticus TaxID=190893 RepID=UPI00187C33B7|nr:hypothetical protein [Vibrio coralliilyticus]
MIANTDTRLTGKYGHVDAVTAQFNDQPSDNKKTTRLHRLLSINAKRAPVLSAT